MGVQNGLDIFTAAAQPKSYVLLDGADHLLQDRASAAYAANLIEAWSQRYLPAGDPTSLPETP